MTDVLHMQKGPEPDRGSMRNTVILLPVLYAAFHLWATWFQPLSPDLQEVLQNIFQIIPPLVAGAFGCLYAIRGRFSSPLLRIGWLLVAGGCLCWAAGQTLWTLLESSQETPPFPGWPELGFLSAYPLLFTGLLFLFGRTNIAERARIMVDSLLASVSAGILAWVYLLEPILHTEASVTVRLLGIAYPVGDLAILFCALIISRGGKADRQTRRSLGFMSAGLVLLVFADAGFSWDTLHLQYQTGSWYEWMWSLGWGFMASAFLIPLYSPALEPGPRPPPPAPVQMPRLLFRASLPYMAALAAIAALAWRQLHAGAISTSEYLLISGLFLLVILRQIFLLARNRRLAERTRLLNDELSRHLLHRNEQMGQLYREMSERQRVEKELVLHQEKLEETVRERTAELQAANVLLNQEMEEQRHLQEQLLRAQKLETVGRLAGGIAHDFNNLLTVINGYGEVLQRAIDDDDPRKADVLEIQKAGKRGAALTQRLRAFTRSQIMRPMNLNLNEMIGDMVKMLELLVGERGRLDFLPCEPLGMVKSDPNQLEQVIINLVVNAADALARGGSITVSTANVCVKEPFTCHRQEIAAGNYVEICVEDTGSGMSDNVQEHLFEPFFTTKPKGKGIGLGLAMVYDIVRTCGGHILVESQPGIGTRIRIRQPIVNGTPVPAASEADTLDAFKGTETILLVEDEEGVLKMTGKMLSQQGYRVLPARDAQEALHIGRMFKGSIDLLLTDVMMPGMNGVELAHKLAVDRPATKALFMSGYSTETMRQYKVEFLPKKLIHKPFTTHELLSSIRHTLDALPEGRRAP